MTPLKPYSWQVSEPGFESKVFSHTTQNLLYRKLAEQIAVILSKFH